MAPFASSKEHKQYLRFWAFIRDQRRVERITRSEMSDLLGVGFQFLSQHGYTQTDELGQWLLYDRPPPPGIMRQTLHLLEQHLALSIPILADEWQSIERGRQR